MLMPKRMKYRKPHRPKPRGRVTKGATVAFGEWGLQALESAWITNRQIEAARVAMTRSMKRGGKVWIRIFPNRSITKKPAETRMGKGKGSPEEYIAPVKAGKVLFEVAGVKEETAKRALQLASFKLGARTKVIGRQVLGGA